LPFEDRSNSDPLGRTILPSLVLGNSPAHFPLKLSIFFDQCSHLLTIPFFVWIQPPVVRGEFSALSQKLSTILSSSWFPRDRDLKAGLPMSPEFYIWTLTHPSRAFSEIRPIFNSREDLLNHVISYESESYLGEIATIAERKANDEWRAWVNVHSDMAIDEFKLDNILMMTLHHLIINRDSKKCILCNSSSSLVIHHIIPKQRNILRKAPPFGRSVPTNLITLCQTCHSKFHSFFC
jgi:hypothetical protein